ncbi:type IV pilin protein [Archangium lansingense]|uniref:Prepilin-type N-terminal cleavage/methylation domain-containing protein n=1 Tax=Archangium lansingense TaxID=2995310 RepID=A0ABT4AB26_9BACT|nr:prepilin-type N-terminal cleavage/methylation domain-containing protein [Archangium lansinium]MCY1078845.1 prepilin-type N-terminal cleavage/methylation domain-containing protein [Archangium lansinium]
MANRRPHPSRTRRGFSIIELMIVVCIVGLLATVALPEFQNILLRSKQAERDMMMNSIMRVLNEYVAAHGGQFPGGAAPDLPFNPTYVPDGSKQRFEASVGKWDDLGWVPDGMLHYRYEVRMTGDELLVTAAADLNGDLRVSYKELKYKLQNGSWQRLSERVYGDHF